jgi:cell division initiation protein
MKITPLDVQQQQFKKKGGRYEAGEVDAFLEMVRLEMEETNRIVDAQASEIRRYKEELSELRSQERILKEAIITTQRAADDIKEHARKEGEIMLAEARMQAEKILDQAQHQVERLRSEIADLQRQRIHLQAQFRATLESQLTLLEATEADSRDLDSQIDKVALMGGKK